MHGFTSPSGLILAIWAAQSGRCFHCKGEMHLMRGNGLEKAKNASREHIFARANRGKGLLNNVVLAHAGCNHKRGAPLFPTDDEIARTKAIYASIGLIAFVPAKDEVNAGIQAGLIAAKFNGPNSDWYKSKATLGDVWPSPK